jgi:threonine dehydrogenase-like Zn-dependent dehydrogenase
MSPDPAVGGSFSELVKAVDADMVLAHIPDAVTDVQAVMVDDMVATGFTGVENMERPSSWRGSTGRLTSSTTSRAT